MSCVKVSLAPPALPPLGVVSLPTLVLPSFGASVNLCCQINLSAYVSLPNIPIPILGAAMSIIAADLAILTAYLHAVDLTIDCPMD